MLRIRATQPLCRVLAGVRIHAGWWLKPPKIGRFRPRGGVIFGFRTAFASPCGAEDRIFLSLQASLLNSRSPSARLSKYPFQGGTIAFPRAFCTISRIGTSPDPSEAYRCSTSVRGGLKCVAFWQISPYASSVRCRAGFSYATSVPDFAPSDGSPTHSTAFCSRSVR